MIRTLFVATIAAFVLGGGMIATAQAADPSGEWSWKMTRGEQEFDVRLELKAEGEKLTGTLGRGQRQTEIQDGTFRDGQVRFKVVRERDGQSFTSQYQGKLDGDSITGTMEVEFGGQTRSRDWEAKRVK